MRKRERQNSQALYREVWIRHGGPPTLIQEPDYLIILPLNLTYLGCFDAETSCPLRIARFFHGPVCLCQGGIELSTQKQIFNLGVPGLRPFGL